MKKVIVVGFLSLFTVALMTIGCGEKYSDAKAVNEEFISLVEDYIGDLDKAGNAEEMAAAIQQFGDGMEDLMPRMKKIAEKYPELKNNADLPEDLKATQAKVEEMSQKMVASMMKLMPYMMDPEVQKAQQRLGEVMTDK